MKKFFAVVMILFVAMAFMRPVQAQENPIKREEEKTIIITKKSGPEIVVTTDSVESIVINGEEIVPGDVSSIRVRPRIVKGYKIREFTPNRSLKAFLGVATKDNEKGAEIMEVTNESPAQKAGFETGDIITKVGDKKIEGPQQLAEAIQAHKPGDKVEITFLRNKKSKTVKVELAKQKDMYSFFKDSLLTNGFGNFDFSPHSYGYNFSAPRIMFRGFNHSPSLGLQVQDTEDESGVTVLKVEANSAAEKAGVKVGDLVTAINGNDVKDVNSVLDAMREVENNQYAIQVKRDGKLMTIDVKIPKKLKKAEL